MSEITLLIKPEDVIILTTLAGNIDEDSLNPVIFIAQTTHLKSFLGLKLYNKIHSDYTNNALQGVYLEMFDNYIKDVLCYKTASLYVELSGYKVSELGIHKINSENREVISESEINSLSLRLNKLAANIEGNFKEYVQDLDVPELENNEINTDNNFPWH